MQAQPAILLPQSKQIYRKSYETDGKGGGGGRISSSVCM
jgi:hypothetical protein